jgi:hypothetical protein
MTPFEEFSAAYPRAKRESGQLAQLAFATALRKAPLATLLAAVDAQTRSDQWAIPRHIPWMTIWLQEERWCQVLLAPTPIAPARLSPADEAQRWRSLSPQEQLRRLGLKR